MRIFVNGKESAAPEEITLESLLRNFSVMKNDPGTAVAVDEEVIPKTHWNNFILKEGSRIEIVRAVQGG
ncbi:MAG: sulfur carrier protein ThiS [Firmicutes bacterium]|nr:sulfur carrier protein ThiS [Bacillota bacterium]